MKKSDTDDCENWEELESHITYEEYTMNDGLIDAVKSNWLVWSVILTIGYCIGAYVHHGMV